MTLGAAATRLLHGLVEAPARARAIPWLATRGVARPAGSVCLAAGLFLAACGGGSSDPLTFQQAVDQANQAEVQARALGVAAPCQSTAQCGVLTFLEPPPCQKPSYQVYSTISATAQAASAAASNEVMLAQQAVSLYNPATPPPCALVIVVAPTPVCTASVCQAAP